MIPGLLLLMFFQPLCFFNPSVLRPPPLYLLRKTQGRSVIHVFLYSSMCFLYNNIKHSHLLPLYCCVTRQRESVRFDFVTVAVFSTPPSFGHLPYILFGNKTQGRSLKVTLYSYRLSHNNGERRGKFFAKNVFFAILVAQKGGKNYGETSIFRLGLEFGE